MDVHELLVRLDATSEGLRKELAKAGVAVENTSKQIERAQERMDRSFGMMGKAASGFLAVVVSEKVVEFTKQVIDSGAAGDEAKAALDRLRGAGMELGGALASHLTPALNAAATGIGAIADAVGTTAAERVERLTEALEKFDERASRGRTPGAREWQERFGATREGLASQLADAQAELANEQFNEMLAGVVRDADDTRIQGALDVLGQTRDPKPTAPVNQWLQFAEEARGPADDLQLILDDVYARAEQLAKLNPWEQFALSEEAQAATEHVATAISDMHEQMESQWADFGGGLGRGLQDTFADALMGVETDFGDMLRRMAAQAAASQLFSAFASMGGPIGTAFSFLSGRGIDGTRAEGGPVFAGRGYLVGERGPELFSPGVTGTITPNHALGSAPEMKVTVINNAANVVQTEQRQTGPGSMEIVVGLMNQAGANGALDALMASRYGLRPTTGMR